MNSTHNKTMVVAFVGYAFFFQTPIANAGTVFSSATPEAAAPAEQQKEEAGASQPTQPIDIPSEAQSIESLALAGSPVVVCTFSSATPKVATSAPSEQEKDAAGTSTGFGEECGLMVKKEGAQAHTPDYAEALRRLQNKAQENTAEESRETLLKAVAHHEKNVTAAAAQDAWTAVKSGKKRTRVFKRTNRASEAASASTHQEQSETLQGPARAQLQYPRIPSDPQISWVGGKTYAQAAATQSYLKVTEEKK